MWFYVCLCTDEKDSVAWEPTKANAISHLVIGVRISGAIYIKVNLGRERGVAK